MKMVEPVEAVPSGLFPLAAALRDGSLPLLDYLAWLEKHFEAREPEVKAFVPEEGRFERLHRRARLLLEQYPQPASRPPLFGIPLGVKDIFHVSGFLTRAGSDLPPERLAGAEAPVVTALKKAGVLILGKTVTTEFAYFAPGPTRNPHDPAHTPGGSSSGSAAAVGAALCPLALGTQTIGSVIRPAAFCGVVGYKPSYDRVSREGVIPLSPSLDHVGFFTPEVAGAERVAALVCASWQPPVAGALVERALPRLGVPQGPYLENATPESLRHFHALCDRLQEAGVEVKTVPAMAEFERVVAQHRALMAAEAAAVHKAWGEFTTRYHPRTSELLARGRRQQAEEVAAARAGREAFRRELLALMDEHHVDLWIAPAAPGPAPQGLDSTGDPIMNLPWTYSGLPVLGMPSGFAESGLPLGVQFIGRWHGDEALLQWGNQLYTLIENVLERMEE